MSWQDYLRLGRAQTAAVEGAGFPLAAWIGGAPIWALPLFALLGILSHFGGFGENGLTDLRFDRRDPAKADHPLVSGRLSFAKGMGFVYGCQAAGLVLFFGVFALLGRSYELLPALAFLGYVVLGHCYNLFGKAWKLGAVLEISAAFALAFLATATAWADRPDLLIWVVTLYAGAMTAFQIGIAGEVKEIGQTNEPNLLRQLGTRLEPTAGADPGLSGADPLFIPARGTVALSWGLTEAKVAALTAIAWLIAGDYWGILVAGLSETVLVIYGEKLLALERFVRAKRMKLMGMGEAASYLLLVLALAPGLGWALALAFLALPVLWYGGMNRVLWARTGSAWAPGV